jgi:hypothetical protein
MSYEEARLDCPACGRETWHGRDVADVFRSRGLTALSHLITLSNNLLIPWTCLGCGRRTRGRPKPGPYIPGSS